MKPCITKSVASFVVFVFIVTSITPVSFANLSATPEVSLFPAKTLEIPAQLGQVTEIALGNVTSPALIHLASSFSCVTHPPKHTV